ncbi:MAG: SseB family protein [bacterium]
MGLFSRKKKVQEEEEKEVFMEDLPREAEEAGPEADTNAGARESNGREGTFSPKEMRVYPANAKLPEDGEAEKLLSFLVDKHKEENNNKSMASVLSALPPAKFWVPLRILLHKDDLERLKAAGEKERVTPQKPVQFAPDILKNPEGKGFFPVFILAEDIPEEYHRKFQWTQLYSGHCLGNVVRNEKLSGLVINPFTSGLVLPREMLMKIITVQEKKPEENGGEA